MFQMYAVKQRNRKLNHNESVSYDKILNFQNGLNHWIENNNKNLIF